MAVQILAGLRNSAILKSRAVDDPLPTIGGQTVLRSPLNISPVPDIAKRVEGAAGRSSDLCDCSLTTLPGDVVEVEVIAVRFSIRTDFDANVPDTSAGDQVRVEGHELVKQVHS